jgi:magnesium transporter
VEDRDALIQAVRRQLARGPEEPLVALLEDVAAEEIALVLRGLVDEEVRAALERLRRDSEPLFTEVLTLLDPHDVAQFLHLLPDEVVADILENVAADDAVWLAELLEEDRVESVVDAMEEEESREVRERLEYPEDSAGRLMSDEFIALSPEATAGDAIARLRQAGEEVTIVYVYLVDEQERLCGVVSLRRLIRVAAERPLRQLSPAPDDVISVSLYDDQEEVAQVFAHYDLVCVPVVDERSRLVGVITHDDVLDVVREEATEDMLHMAGTTREDVLAGSVWTSARLLKAGETHLGPLFGAIVVFAPLIVGMGGNVGMQAATLVVRGMATGRIQRHDSWRVFAGELRVALIVGLAYGCVLCLASWLIVGEGLLLSAVVGIALAASMLLAALFGCTLPIAFQAVHVDPAVATGPLVTTMIDILGIASYLVLAGWLLVG